MEYKSVWQRLEERKNAFHDKKAFEQLKTTPECAHMTDAQIARSCERADKWFREFNAYNSSIADSLGRLAEQPQDIQGRDSEIKLLQAIMCRPITPVALLVGKAGAGKSSLVEEFTKQANTGRLVSDDNELISAKKYSYMVVALRLGQLSALDRNKLQSALSTVFNQMKYFEEQAQLALQDVSVHIILFIDEVHMLVTIFGEGTKIGGDVAKDSLARAPIRVIGATTDREYDSTIAVDKPLAERFKIINIQEIPLDVVHKACINWWEKVAPDCPMVSDEVIDYVIDSNAAYRPDEAEPRKTLDILEDLVSYCRRTGKPADKQQVALVFKERFSVELGFNIDADKVYNNIAAKVWGQPAALRAWNLALHALAFSKRQNSNRPIFTALLTGSTASGKTSTTKALAETLYKGQDALVTINIPEFANDEDAPAFRKLLGETVRHKRNAVIQLDEFEKGSKAFRQDCLYILDEGLVNYTVMNREGREEQQTVSLRNTIIIATTNAGSNVFKDDTAFSVVKNDENEFGDLTVEQEAQLDNLMVILRQNLQDNGFRPELLGRFDQIIPYRGLSEKTSLRIIETKIKSMVKEFKEFHDINIITNDMVQWDSEQYNCVATDLAVYVGYMCIDISDTNSGGARRIDSEIKQNIFYRIVQSIMHNPNSRTFKVGVRGVYTVEGKGRDDLVYRLDNEVKEGVYVEPID